MKEFVDGTIRFRTIVARDVESYARGKCEGFCSLEDSGRDAYDVRTAALCDGEADGTFARTAGAGVPRVRFARCEGRYDLRHRIERDGDAVANGDRGLRDISSRLERRSRAQIDPLETAREEARGLLDIGVQCRIEVKEAEPVCGQTFGRDDDVDRTRSTAVYRERADTGKWRERLAQTVSEIAKRCFIARNAREREDDDRYVVDVDARNDGRRGVAGNDVAITEQARVEIDVRGRRIRADAIANGDRRAPVLRRIVNVFDAGDLADDALERKRDESEDFVARAARSVGRDDGGRDLDPGGSPREGSRARRKRRTTSPRSRARA